jgi:hypothetical protein
MSQNENEAPMRRKFIKQTLATLACSMTPLTITPAYAATRNASEQISSKLAEQSTLNAKQIRGLVAKIKKLLPNLDRRKQGQITLNIGSRANIVNAAFCNKHSCWQASPDQPDQTCGGQACKDFVIVEGDCVVNECRAHIIGGGHCDTEACELQTCDQHTCTTHKNGSDKDEKDSEDPEMHMAWQRIKSAKRVDKPGTLTVELIQR